MSAEGFRFRRAAFLGATSELARAVMRELPELEELWLLGRSEARLEAVAREFPGCRTHVLAVSSLGAAEAAAASAALPLDLDLIFIAQGMLFGSAERDLSRWEEMARVNFLFPSLFLEACIERRFPGGAAGADALPLSVAVVGSVAGDRARASNYWYGTGKAALAAHMEGLDAWAFQKGLPLRVSLVKPGLLATPMIAARRDRRLVSSPEAAARQVVRGLRKGAPVIYAPLWWAPMMWVVRHLPRWVSRRIHA